MAAVQCQSAMAEPESFVLWSSEDAEAFKILLRVLITCLAVYIIRPTVHAIYCTLSDSIYRRVWTLAHEDLNDYNHEHTNALADGDVCCICREEFNHSSDDTKQLCVPIVLRPCAHVVGEKCFSRWVTSFNDTQFAGSMRCPYCSQPVFRRPQALCRRFTRIITTSVAFVRSIDWRMELDGMRHHTPTPEDHAAARLERLRLLRYAKPTLQMALAVLDTRTALLIIADVLRDIYGESRFSSILALGAGAQHNFAILYFFTLPCVGIFVFNELVIREIP